MNFRIVVNSTSRFYRKTVPLCVESLRAAEVSDILVVIGGSSSKYVLEDGVEYVFVPYDNFDLTSFIYLSEQNEYKNVFYMHDTCRVGPEFKRKLIALQIDPNRCAKMACDGMSMNIGYYPFQFIKKHEKELVPLKNFDLTEEGIKNAKLLALRYEDFIFRKESVRVLSTGPRRNTFDVAPYENSVRLEEYYATVDLYKYKANYNLAAHPLRVDL